MVKYTHGYGSVSPRSSQKVLEYSAFFYPLSSPMIYSAGLLVYVREVLSTGLFWQIYVPAYLLLLLGWYTIRRWMIKPDDMPAPLNKLSILSIVPFVRSRYDFLNWGFQSTGQTVFRFRLLDVGPLLRLLVILLKCCSIRNRWWQFSAKAAGLRFSRLKGSTYTLGSTICLVV